MIAIVIILCTALIVGNSIFLQFHINLNMNIYCPMRWFLNIIQNGRNRYKVWVSLTLGLTSDVLKFNCNEFFERRFNKSWFYMFYEKWNNKLVWSWLCFSWTMFFWFFVSTLNHVFNFLRNVSIIFISFFNPACVKPSNLWNGKHVNLKSTSFYKDSL